MEDAQLVAAFLDGDSSAFATIYDRYADRLHDFCHSVLRDRDEAGDALQEAMLVAHQRLGQLRDPSLLRPWLFSIARHEAYRRARQRRRAVPTDDVGAHVTVDDHVAEGAVEPERSARATETSRLVWDAAAGLAARDRVVLDLHVRQGLSGGDLATALGVTAHHADVLLSRVRRRVERSLGALLVARLGSDDCDELEGLLAGWDGAFSTLLRKRVARHVDDCEVCGETQRRVASPLALLGAMPFAPAPPELRDRVLGEIQRISSTRPRSRTVHQRSWSPPPIERDRAKRRALVTIGAAVVVLVLLTFASTDDSPTTSLTAADAAGEPTSSQPTVDGESEQESPAVTNASPPENAGEEVLSPQAVPPSPEASAPATIPPDQPAGPPAPAPAPPAEPPAPAPEPPVGSLDVDTTSIALRPVQPIATVRIRNTGDAPLAWSAEAPGFTLSPSSGTLGTGESVDLSVGLTDSATEGLHENALELTADDSTIGVDVAVDRPPVIEAIRVSPRTAGCSESVTVTVAASDESGLTARLWWTTPSDGGSIVMTPDGAGWSTTFTPTSGPVDIDVVVTDARGNSTTGDGGVVAVADCAPPRRR